MWSVMQAKPHQRIQLKIGAVLRPGCAWGCKRKGLFSCFITLLPKEKRIDRERQRQRKILKYNQHLLQALCIGRYIIRGHPVNQKAQTVMHSFGMSLFFLFFFLFFFFYFLFHFFCYSKRTQFYDSARNRVGCAYTPVK